MEKERTFIMIKPDAVQRGLIGQIISRFEQKGIKIIAMKMVAVDRHLAEQHYAIHRGKPFFEPTVQYIISSPVIAMVLEGINAIEMVRGMMGKTNPQEATMGTIRGDYGQLIGRNIVHGSDGKETAEKEIKLWFTPKEIAHYTRIDEQWMTE
ncbi:MAG: nucleoside-diphosphate kinase [Candidatus Thermoplasmatota archaeon]|nr:nucleoside-diphosphate kinase [Candidatus Thermoplasmatota archaeon]MBU1941806.1 nucleoside-diphosphate kinase [Candidatus Thermoplasmatota archaeon]